MRSGEDDIRYQQMLDIKEVARTGRSIVCSMGSKKRLSFSFDDLHFIPAQVSRMPLEREDKVSTEVTIGAGARIPLKLSSPIMISGMSLGATSRNVKLVISKAAAMLGIAYNSGEGGIQEEEFQSAPNRIIGQYPTYATYIDEERLRRVVAVEIRFGQGAYPGQASILPEGKLSTVPSDVRGIVGVEQDYSPAHHHDMETAEDVRNKVSWLREVTRGVPIGAKIGCGRVEKDVEVLVDSGVDFIALDGFGGGTGGTEQYVRENVGVPIIAALPRASRLLKKLGRQEDIALIAGGGLRTSADFAKCLSLGADAVYTATAALIAINCEQYRLCHTGLCPTGVSTHNRILAKQLDVQRGVERLFNFLKVSTEEMASFTRIVGKDDISKLDAEDLVSTSEQLARITGTRWVGDSW
jgi:glutamate synthase domain-containing protein 2